MRDLSRYPGGFLVGECGRPGNPAASMIVPLPPQRAERLGTLSAHEAQTDYREYPGCEGAEGVTDELLRACNDIRQEGAIVRWVLWRDGTACIVIGSRGSMPVTGLVLLKCYRAVRSIAGEAWAGLLDD